MTAPLRRSPHPNGSSTRIGEATAIAWRDELLAKTAMLSDAWTGHKPEWDTPAASVDPRLFLLLIPHTDDRLLINVKLDPKDVVAMRTTFEWVEPGFHQPKRHWASIDLTSLDYQADGATAMVEDSYRLALSLLTRRMREAVLLVDAAGPPTRPT